MFKFTKSFTAVALAMMAISASAQETSNRGDTFGQELPSTVGSNSSAPSSSSSSSSLPRKQSITNASAQNGLQGIDQSYGQGMRQSQEVGRTGVNGRSQTDRAGRSGNDARDSAEFRQFQQQIADQQAPLSEFQKFIEDNTGKVMPIFGAKFFRNVSPTFTPVANSPVPSDYPLGPGDELLVRGWGTIDIDLRATVDRNGNVSIPTIGSVSLAGVKAGEAENVIRNAVARLYKGVTVSVSFGQLRAITVYVVGQANRPGTYTVSSLSTLVTAMFASGGPNANGSMRRVQVKRGGKVAAELD